MDECIHALGVFSDFANAVSGDVSRLDSHLPTEQRAALAHVLDCACQHRLFSLALPHSLGGAGCSMLALTLGLESLAQRCAGIANLVATHGLALALVGATGNLRLLRVLADQIVEGERSRRPFLLATAATEPSAGSDLEDFDAIQRSRFESHADPVATGYRLNGRKIFVSNGSLASAIVVVMPTNASAPRETLSAFLVFANTPGLEIVRVEDKLGQRASPAAELVFDGCFVAHEYRLNESSVAGRTLDLVLGSSRAAVGAFGAGIARGVWETCRALCAQRRSNDGVRYLDHPYAQAVLARLWSNATLARDAYVSAALLQRQLGLVSLMEAEPLRVLDRIVPTRLTHAAWADKLLGWSGIDREAKRLIAAMPDAEIARASAHGSATKWATSELALKNCELAQTLLGIDATREDTGLPKYWRDARLLSIYEGTNEICALDVAKQLERCHPPAGRST
jgi:alkylation response protein AidB-like acyl-CoA dehydrogenase